MGRVASESQAGDFTPSEKRKFLSIAVKRMLEKDQPNDKARFFDYSVNRTGLVVTVC